MDVLTAGLCCEERDLMVFGGTDVEALKQLEHAGEKRWPLLFENHQKNERNFDQSWSVLTSWLIATGCSLHMQAL